MPHRFPTQPGATSGGASVLPPSKASTAKRPGNGGGGTPSKKRSKKKERNVPLFAFDIVREEYNWGRPKRKIKTISRFDPTLKERQSDCKIGHGFVCPRCSAICTYDSRECYRCHLECCYEAGVGVVVLQDRRISYNPPATRAWGDGRGNATLGRTRRITRDISSSEGNLSKDKPFSSLNNHNGKRGRNHGILTDSHGDRGKSKKKRNMFTDLKEKLKVATAEANSESQQGGNIGSTATAESNSESQQGGNRDSMATAKSDSESQQGGNIDRMATTESNSESQQGGSIDSMANRVKEATQKWTESTIAAAKEGAYSTASSTPPLSEVDVRTSEAAAKPVEPPSLEADINCCQELKRQLLALQSKYDSIMSTAMKAEEEFREAISKLEAAILERNRDAAAFSKTISSSGSKIAEIRKRAGLLTAERDEFVKTVEAKGLSSVPKNVPNYSTRIDALDTKMSQMRSECDAAKERVKDLMSGTEVAKQEKEKAAKALDEMETKHGETFTQCYKEIESFKQQLSDATTKMSTMAAEKAELVENVSSTLIYVSNVRRKAETQASRISELESSNESLARQRDVAAEEREKDIARLSYEKDEAVAKSKSLENTVDELRCQIESLKSQAKAEDTKHQVSSMSSSCGSDPA